MLLFKFEISYVASLRQSPYFSGTVHRCVCDAEAGDRLFHGQQLKVWSAVVKLHVQSEMELASQSHLRPGRRALLLGQTGDVQA